MRLRTMALGGTLLLALAGCGSTTAGNGTTSSATAPTAPTAPTSAAASTPASDPSTDAPTSSAPTASGARFDDPTEVAAVLADARTDFEAINSYDYRNLAQAKAAGAARTTASYTGLYLSAFRLIEQQAPTLRAVQKAVVTQAAVGSIEGDTAVTLLFGRLTVITKDSPAPGKLDPFTVRLTVQHVGSSWLVGAVALDGPVLDTPPGTSELAAAARSARAGVGALLSFRRAHFDSDYARALDRTTGELRRELAGRRAATRKALTRGHFDLTATVRSVATSTASGDTAAFLVRADEKKVTDGRAGTSTPQSLRVSLTRVGATWLLDDVQSVGTS